MSGFGEFMKMAGVARLRKKSSPSKPGIAPGAPVTFFLQEGDAVTVKSAAASTGTVQQYDASGTLVKTTLIAASTTMVFGAFPGVNSIVVTTTAGSIDVTVGDAVLGAVKITDQRKSPVMPSRIYILLPTPPVATDGAAHTYDVQIPAKRAIYGMRLIDMNLNTAAVMNISASRVGSAPKHLNSNGSECLWNANLSTVKGATSWAVTPKK
jgi:hypothetical protein